MVASSQLAGSVKAGSTTVSLGRGSEEGAAAQGHRAQEAFSSRCWGTCMCDGNVAPEGESYPGDTWEEEVLEKQKGSCDGSRSHSSSLMASTFPRVCEQEGRGLRRGH